MNRLDDEARSNLEAIVGRQANSETRENRHFLSRLRSQQQQQNPPTIKIDSHETIRPATVASMETLPSTAGSSSSFSSISPDETTSSNKRDKNRLLTIRELIETERDYYLEIKYCYDVFMTTKYDSSVCVRVLYYIYNNHEALSQVVE